MQIVKIPGECPGCKEKLIVEANLFTATIKIMLEQKPARWGMKLAVVGHYKKLKGLDKVSTWDGAYRARGIKAASKILFVFRKLENPVGIAIELLNDTEDRATKQQWADWNLDSCAKRAGEWLAAKQTEPRRRQ